MIRASGNWVASDREVRDRIAKNVTDLLEMRGMSRRELARKTGDSVAAIARVAAGRHTAGAGMLVRVADALGVNVERLIMGNARSTARALDRTKKTSGPKGSL